MGEEKSNVVITEEGALSVKKLTFWEAAMIIVGANIGAGILGLAYSSRKAGWPILLMWLIIAGVFTTVSMLYVAETTLRTKKPMQLPGLAERYVGKLGAVLVFISVCANSIGCMISYTSGSGEILAELLGISPTLGSLIFTVPAVVVVWLGLKATGLAEKFISTGMIVLLAVIIGVSFLSGKADISQAIYTNWTYAVPVFNVAIFCYIAQYAVPELARGLRHNARALPKAVTIGMLITGILLALVPLAVISLTGPDNVTEVATLAWGQALGSWAMFVANIFALCAMMTSYWAVGGSMLTNIVDMFKFKSENHVPTRLISLACVALPPFHFSLQRLGQLCRRHLPGWDLRWCHYVHSACADGKQCPEKRRHGSRPGSAAGTLRGGSRCSSSRSSVRQPSMRFWIWWGSCPQAGKRGRKMQCVSFPKTK